MSIEALIAAIVAMTFHLSPDQARIHVEAAEAAATEDVPVELLLGMAYVESRFDPRALSRVECTTKNDPSTCARKTGIWASSTRPPKAKPSWYCGPMQTGGYVSWAECQRMREDVPYAYQVGAEHLTAWLNDKRCRVLRSSGDRLRCALAGYNGGNVAVAAYDKSRYVNWVFAARDRVVKFAVKPRAAAKPSS